MMIIKYDDAPEAVRKFAFSLMHLCIGQELWSSDDPRALLALGAQAGVDAHTHAEALRWLAEQRIKNYELKGVVNTRRGALKAAERYLACASKIDATLAPSAD